MDRSSQNPQHATAAGESRVHRGGLGYACGMDFGPAIERLREWLSHERCESFARFVWRRFVDDRCFESAGALAYTTVFALVPASAVALGVVSGFPVFQVWTDQLANFVFSNFVPDAAGVVADYLLEFATGVSGLPMLGLAGLVLAAILTLSGIEVTFNRIWRVESQRSTVVRFLIYWTVLTLGILLAIASVALSSYLFSLPLLTDDSAAGQGNRLLRAAPTLVALCGFTLAYIVVPNRKVAFTHALVGGLLATLLFELAKFGLAEYLRRVPSYQQVYGALAVIPIFLLWVYLSWVAVLLGASLTASLSAFRFQPSALRLPPGHELYALLRLLARFRGAHRAGRTLEIRELAELEPSLSDDLRQHLLAQLERLGVLAQSDAGGWVLARDLSALSLRELYEAGTLRVPTAECRLPGADDAIGRAVLPALEALRGPLRSQLERPVASLFEPIDEEETRT